MKIKNGFVAREIDGQTIVVSTGALSREFRGMIELNTTGAEIWQFVSEGLTAEQITDKLIEKYNIDRELSQKAVNNFIGQMQSAGVLEDE